MCNPAGCHRVACARVLRSQQPGSRRGAGRVARTIAIANQKGGVAKTTTAVALGAAIAESGARVLLVDLDPQASLSYSMGLDPDSLDVTIHDVLVGRVPI